MFIGIRKFFYLNRIKKILNNWRKKHNSQFNKLDMALKLKFDYMYKDIMILLEANAKDIMTVVASSIRRYTNEWRDSLLIDDDIITKFKVNHKQNAMQFINYLLKSKCRYQYIYYNLDNFLTLTKLHLIKAFNDHRIFQLRITSNIYADEVIQVLTQSNTKSIMIRLIADNIEGMIWYKDAQNRYMFASRKLRETLLFATEKDTINYTDTEIALRRRSVGNVHEFGEICEETDNFTKDKGITCEFVEFACIDGNELTLLVRKTPIYDENNNLMGTLGIAFDGIPKDVLVDMAKKQNAIKLKKSGFYYIGGYADVELGKEDST